MITDEEESAYSLRDVDVSLRYRASSSVSQCAKGTGEASPVLTMYGVPLNSLFEAAHVMKSSVELTRPFPAK